MSIIGSRDEPLIDRDVLEVVMAEVRHQADGGDLNETIDIMCDTEPVLGQFVQEYAERAIARLTLSGAPTEVAQSVFVDIVQIAHISTEALRRGLIDNWDSGCDEDVYTVVLTSGSFTPTLIRALHETAGMSLAEAERLVRAVPAKIIDGADFAVAVEIVKRIEAAGGSVEIY